MVKPGDSRRAKVKVFPMAVWRTKACELFGFNPAEYSFAHGKKELFADLIQFARDAGCAQDEAVLNRISDYVTWASRQKSEELASVVDLAFFLPVFRDPTLHELFRHRLNPDLLNSKWSLLMENANDDG